MTFGARKPVVGIGFGCIALLRASLRLLGGLIWVANPNHRGGLSWNNPHFDDRAVPHDLVKALDDGFVATNEDSVVRQGRVFAAGEHS